MSFFKAPKDVQKLATFVVKCCAFHMRHHPLGLDVGFLRHGVFLHLLALCWVWCFSLGWKRRCWSETNFETIKKGDSWKNISNETSFKKKDLHHLHHLLIQLSNFGAPSHGFHHHWDGFAEIQTQRLLLKVHLVKRNAKIKRWSTKLVWNAKRLLKNWVSGLLKFVMPYDRSQISCNHPFKIWKDGTFRQVWKAPKRCCISTLISTSFTDPSGSLKVKTAPVPFVSACHMATQWQHPNAEFAKKTARVSWWIVCCFSKLSSEHSPTKTIYQFTEIYQLRFPPKKVWIDPKRTSPKTSDPKNYIKIPPIISKHLSFHFPPQKKLPSSPPLKKTSSSAHLGRGHAVSDFLQGGHRSDLLHTGSFGPRGVTGRLEDAF